MYGAYPAQQQSDRRARLAQAILKATGGGEPQPVEHPTQAIGNAMQQIAAANIQRQRPRPPGSGGAAAGRWMRPLSTQMIRPASGLMRVRPKAG